MPRIPRDDYYVFMWNFISPLFTEGPEKAARAVERFKEMACNGGTCMATFVNPDSYNKSLDVFGLPRPGFERPDMGASPFQENDFPFYVENVCRTLYWDWKEGKPAFQKQYAAFEREGDRKVFTRTPCVNNPTANDAMMKRIDDVMDGLKDVRHLSYLYDLRDEPSITSFLLASDSCFCEHCMAGMRDWLKTQYADLAALNSEWDSEFGSWDEVEPITTMEALGRREAGNWNFAPWHDHRTFMNESFARACAAYAERIRKHDPEARVGLAGTQCPWVFGGYDFSKFVPVLDWAEPYDFGSAADCYRSFKPRRHFPMLRTSGLGKGLTLRRVMLWTFLLQSGGDAGTIIWNSNTSLNTESKDLELADGAEDFGKVYAELRSGFAKLLQQSEPLSSPVALHYSQASINADFITSVPNRWQSVAAAEAERYAALKCREAWKKLLEDRGLRPIFVSGEQIESGELLKRGIKLLILPRSIAVSDAEAAEMAKFVEAGGTLAADSFAGRMDEHCRERETGALDELFGIKRTESGTYHASSQRSSLSWDAPAGERPRWGGGKLRAECALIEEGVEPLKDTRVCGCSEYSDTPLGMVREHGKGRAVLLNTAPVDYLIDRVAGSGGAAFRKFFGGVIEMAGLESELDVRNAKSGADLAGWRAFQFAHEKARYFGLAPDLAVTQDVLGAIEVTGDQDAGLTTVDLKFPVAGHVYESRSGRYLGEGDSFREELDPGFTRLYAVMPYKVEGLTLNFDGKVAAAKLKTEKKAGEHVLRFDLFDDKGKRLLDSGINAVAPGGTAEWKPEGPFPAGGKLVCRDVATGVSAEVKLS